MRKTNKKMSRSRSGVSDIIANLLILAITVTLFSSVMFYVANMPAPAEATFTDMEPSLSNTIGNSIWVNVTHKGGQTLNNWSTGIYIFVNGAYTGELNITDNEGLDIGDEWETGETWSYLVDFTPPLDTLSVLIVDKNTNCIVWQSELLGGMTNVPLPPIITERYTSPSPGLENETLSVFVRVIDPNDDEIVDVHLDLSTIGMTSNLTMTKTSNNMWYAELPQKADFQWDNRRIIIHATDETGLHSSALMALDIIPESGGGGGGGGGSWPPGNLDYSGLQGFAIFEWQDWEDNRFEAEPTRTFNWGSEDAVVVVASKYVVNTNGENIIRVLNQTTKVIQSAVSTPNNEYVQYDFIYGYYIYNLTIDTSLLPMVSSYYSLESSIVDTWVPNNEFKMNARIFISYPADQLPSLPEILTFKDSSFTTEWSNFTTYDPSTNKIYVEVRDLYGQPWTPYSGDVEIRDFFWNAQIQRTPAYAAGASAPTAWNGPVSNLWQVVTSPPPGVYRFVINLANATDGWPWIGGNNAYVLKFDMFKAGIESYLLNTLVHIDAPETKLDIVAGSPPAGGARFTEQASLYYYHNDNHWSPPDILEIANDKHAYAPVVYAVRAGDINGDGRGDFVAMLFDDRTAVYPLYVYYSQAGGGWIKATITSNVDTWGKNNYPDDFYMELGNLDLDNDLDIVIGYDGDVYMYRNDGAWTRTTIGMHGTDLGALMVADMDSVGTPGDDPERSLDVVVARGGVLTIYKNQYGDGTSWLTESLATSGTADARDYAIGETTVKGTTLNDYTYTQGAFQNDGFSQRLYESITYRYATSYPAHEDPVNNTVNDPVSQLNPNLGTGPYTVQPNEVAYIAAWDNTYLTGAPVMLSAKFMVNYTTEDSSNHVIQWYNKNTGLWVDMITIHNTGGLYVKAEYNLTSFFTSAADLADIWVRFDHTGGTYLVDFNYWKLDVSWVIGDSLSHIYEFDITPGSAHQFLVYAARHASTDGDQFRFEYSTNMVNWTTMTTVASVYPTFTQYTYNLPAGVSGALYVRVNDTDRTISATPAIDFIEIDQMYVLTTATSTSLGTNIKAMDIADVDGNGGQDIVVVSARANTGYVYVLYNKFGMSIFNPANIVQVASHADFDLAKWVFAGSFFNPYNKGYLDIIVGLPTSVTSIYAVIQSPLGTFDATPDLMSFSAAYRQGSAFSVTKMLATDVDGNGRCDLLFGTADGYIIMFANYGGTTTSAGWQSYLIDILGIDSKNAVVPVRDMDAAVFET